MKKYFIFICIFASLFLISAKALNRDRAMILEDINTLNFSNKSGVDIHSVQKICSYDFCDYIRSDNVKRAMEIFTDNYLKTIEDEEIKNTLKVKGIKITKIIVQN